MGKTMAIATGELEKTFPGMIKMNEPSVKIWKWIEQGKEPDEIYSLYAESYSIDAGQAKQEVDSVIEKMTSANIFE